MSQPKRPEHKPAPTDDSIFFHKGQLTTKTRLVYRGRLDPGSLWRVTSIVTYDRPLGTGTYRRREVSSVVRLNDDITLTRIGSNETRSASFGYLSYSAIWRLP